MVNRQRFGIAAAALAALITLSACSNTESDTRAQASTNAGTSAPNSSTTSAAAPFDDADVAFAQGMLPHHEQAIDMSDMLLAKQGVDPRVLALANAVKAAQTPEIEQLKSWLGEWGAATTPSSAASRPVRMSDQDMEALQNAQGAAAGQLFLTQMIEHHEGAITMARQEIGGGRFPAAVTMAHSIVSTQEQEIATMRQLLESP